MLSLVNRKPQKATFSIELKLTRTEQDRTERSLFVTVKTVAEPVEKGYDVSKTRQRGTIPP